MGGGRRGRGAAAAADRCEAEGVKSRRARYGACAHPARFALELGRGKPDAGGGARNRSNTAGLDAEVVVVAARLVPPSEAVLSAAAAHCQVSTHLEGCDGVDVRDGRGAYIWGHDEALGGGDHLGHLRINSGAGGGGQEGRRSVAVAGARGKASASIDGVHVSKQPSPAVPCTQRPSCHHREALPHKHAGTPACAPPSGSRRIACPGRSRPPPRCPLLAAA